MFCKFLNSSSTINKIPWTEIFLKTFFPSSNVWRMFTSLLFKKIFTLFCSWWEKTGENGGHVYIRTMLHAKKSGWWAPARLMSSRLGNVQLSSWLALPKHWKIWIHLLREDKPFSSQGTWEKGLEGDGQLTRNCSFSDFNPCWRQIQRLLMCTVLLKWALPNPSSSFLGTSQANTANLFNNNGESEAIEVLMPYLAAALCIPWCLIPSLFWKQSPWNDWDFSECICLLHKLGPACDNCCWRHVVIGGALIQMLHSFYCHSCILARSRAVNWICSWSSLQSLCF